MKTYNAPANVEHNWVVIDATDVVVGRLASYVAKRLRGKHRADFTPHIDTGDHVVIINADKVKFTGRKMTDNRAASSPRRRKKSSMVVSLSARLNSP
jgi:large subunit ribosomal protein L13